MANNGAKTARMLLLDSAALPSLQALGAASSAFSRARVVERSTPGSRQLERLEHGVTVKGSAACSYARAHHPTELQTHACYTCTKHCVRTVAEQCGRAQRGLSLARGAQPGAGPQACLALAATPFAFQLCHRLVCRSPLRRLSEAGGVRELFAGGLAPRLVTLPRLCFFCLLALIQLNG